MSLAKLSKNGKVPKGVLSQISQHPKHWETLWLLEIAACWGIRGSNGFYSVHDYPVNLVSVASNTGIERTIHTCLKAKIYYKLI